MKKIVWTFGLIAGAIMSVMMVATLPLMHTVSAEKSMIIGYTTMVAAFLLTYFGVRTYRDNVLGGTISFGRAFTVGILITAIGCVCYTATWEVLYYNFMPDFGTKYATAAVNRAQRDGKSEAEVAKVRADMAVFAERYKNPVYNSAMTFLEPLPVGVILTLVSAGVLRRKRRSGEPVLATA
jgi:hypothetical protein